MKKKVIAAFMAGVLTTVMVLVCANWFEHRHDDDVHVTVISKESVTWTNETTGAVISTGLEVTIQTDAGQTYSKVVENTAENNFDLYYEGNDFWIPKEHIAEYWN